LEWLTVHPLPPGADEFGDAQRQVHGQKYYGTYKGQTGFFNCRIKGGKERPDSKALVFHWTYEEVEEFKRRDRVWRNVGVSGGYGQGRSV